MMQFCLEKRGFHGFDTGGPKASPRIEFVRSLAYAYLACQEKRDKGSRKNERHSVNLFDTGRICRGRVQVCLSDLQFSGQLVYKLELNVYTNKRVQSGYLRENRIREQQKSVHSIAEKEARYRKREREREREREANVFFRSRPEIERA